MAFQQYPDSIAVVISDGSPYVIDLGTVQPDVNQQLEVFGVQLFKSGVQPTVTMVVNAYDGATLLATTASVRVADIESAYPATDHFYGWVRFTFTPRMNLLAADTTRFELELTNYTYSDSIFIGAVLDWPITMAYNSTVTTVNAAPMAIELYGAV